jgi:PAS domain S-box-containing protein
MGLFSHNKSGGNSAEVANSLQNEKQKSDIIVNSIDDAVIMVDSTNVVHVFNPGATRLTGWGQGEAENLDYRSIVKFVDDKGQPKGDETHPFFQVLGSGKPFRDDSASLQSKDGGTVSVDISVTPLLNKDKQVTGAVGILRDVHAQRQQEKQRADFISTASHEMRTPVAAIEGYLALALNDKVAKIDANARSYLEKAHASTQHLGKLFQDLLTSAKAEDGRLTSHPEIIEFGEFTEKLVDDLKFTAEKKGLLLELLMGAQQRSGGGTGSSVDVSQKVIKPLLYVQVDPDRMREVITNLFDNAVKYTESGRISIGVTGDSDVVQFHIADTGPGIPKEDIGHLFQKFYRVDNSSTRTIGGTGLGLYISRKIVELYNGRIWVESEPGNGSTFYINIPRIPGDKAQKMIKEQTQSSVGI